MDAPLCKVIPLGGYMLRKPDGAWDLAQVVNKTAAEDHLIALGVLVPRARRNKKQDEDFSSDPDVLGPEGEPWCVGVYGIECFPNKGPLVQIDGRVFANSWTAPALKPAPAPWPRVERLLKWLVGFDPKGEGYEWLQNWIAYKVQHPGNLIGSGVLLCGAPGSGKNTLYRIIAAMLGESNCAIIQEHDVSSRFTAHWSGKLFVLANELVEEHQRAVDLNDTLKALVTDEFAYIERKGYDRQRITNRLGILAGTNNTRVIRLDAGDRRWTVFSNREDPAKTLGPDGLTHERFLSALNTPGKGERFTPEFLAEVAGFAHDLLQRKVDYVQVRRPFANEAREELLILSEHPCDSFLRDLRDAGNENTSAELFARLVNDACLRNFNLRHEVDRNKKIPSARGVTLKLLFAVYAAWCEENGIQHVGNAKTLPTKLKTCGWKDDKTTALRYWAAPFDLWTREPTAPRAEAPGSTAPAA